MERIIVTTNRVKEIVDITETIRKLAEKEKVQDAVCHLFITHTTSSLTVADLDPGTDLDMLDVFEKMVPKLRFRHMHNPEHVPDHIMSAIIGPSLTVPVEDGELVLGTWQRIVVVELDGPRDRTVIVSFTQTL